MKRLLIAVLALLATIGALPASAAVTESPALVLARGAALHGANGVMFDRHDRLYIASVVGREIVVMEPRTGAVLDRLGPAQGVEGPDDLTFGPDGALYWTSFFTGVVGRRAPGGTMSERPEVQHEVCDVQLQRPGEPRRRRNVAGRLRADRVDRRRSKDRRAREEGSELRTEQAD